MFHLFECDGLVLVQVCVFQYLRQDDRGKAARSGEEDVPVKVVEDHSLQKPVVLHRVRVPKVVLELDWSAVDQMAELGNLQGKKAINGHRWSVDASICNATDCAVSWSREEEAPLLYLSES